MLPCDGIPHCIKWKFCSKEINNKHGRIKSMEDCYTSVRPPIIWQYSRREKKGSVHVIGSVVVRAGTHS